MKYSKLALVLFGLLVLGLLANVTPRAESSLPSYPTYTSTITYTTWFQALMADFRTNIHGQLNRSSWFWEGWNLTSGQYINSIHRWSLSDYLFGVIAMHKLTGEDQWLSEAMWLVDNYLLHEGTTPNVDKYSWEIYEIGSHKNWIWHDSRIWMAMDYINDQIGQTYDLTTRLNYLHSEAVIANSTDLAWMYDWKAAYDPSIYTQNALSFIEPIYGFLNQSGYADYTSNATKAYFSLEKFRLANNKYKYQFPDVVHSNRYTLISLFNMLVGYKYMPSIYNLTKFQQTIDAFLITELDGSDEYDRNIATAVAIIASTISGLTLTEALNRTLSMYYNLMNEHYVNKMWTNRIFFLSRYYMDTWSDFIVNALANLVFVGDTSTWTRPTPTIQEAASGYRYLKPNLDNNTYYREPTSAWAELPTWRLSLLQTRLNKYPATIDLTPTFNTTSGQWEDTFTEGGTTFNAMWDTHGYSWNVSSSAARYWRLVYGFGWGTYPYNLIFPNGTVTAVPAGAGSATILGDTAWAIEVRTSGTAGVWVMFNTDNATIEKSVSSTYLQLDSVVSEWEGHLLFVFYTSLDANGWATVESEVAEMLTQMKNGEQWVKREALYPRTQGIIIHSDANISNYSFDNVKMSALFTGAGALNTAIYGADDVESVTGASSWAYNSTTKLLNVTHTSGIIVVDFSSNYNFFVRVLDNATSTAIENASVYLSRVGWTSNTSLTNSTGWANLTGKGYYTLVTSAFNYSSSSSGITVTAANQEFTVYLIAGLGDPYFTTTLYVSGIVSVATGSLLFWYWRRTKKTRTVSVP